MKINKITSYLDTILPDARCELNYTKDYELLIATMLSAQTTDIRVNSATEILFSKYPTLVDLKNAKVDDVIAIIKPLGMTLKKASNVISIAHKIDEIGGYVPNDRTFLESLSGVGRKTTNVVLSNIHHVPCLAVDTHVARVSKRLALADENDDVLVIEQKLTKLFKEEQLIKLHHQLVLFGRYYCLAKRPKCDNCGLKDICDYYKRNITK